MFGSFTYKTRTLGKEITSPFALLAKVTGDKISYIQFLVHRFDEIDHMVGFIFC
jgi:hypothetical protein